MRWLNKDSRKFLNQGYLLPDVTVEDRVEQICETARQILSVSEMGHLKLPIDTTDFYDKLKEAITKGWVSLSSPIWSNFGLERGLPISCFGSYIEDSMENILYTAAEVGMMTKYGGGTSAYFGELRPRGSAIKHNGESAGSAHFAQLFEQTTNVISQGSTRRGAFAGYIPIDHPDVNEWLDFKTEGNKIQDIFSAVVVPEGWMQEMIDGDKKKRKTWAKVIQRRGELGLPYIMFADNANNNKPQVYKDKDMTIWSSNLCTEIMEATNKDEAFVCCLASMNLLYYDEWKDTDAVKTMIFFLDAVMTEFIRKSENIAFLKRAHTFAKNQRALGLGVLGWHSFLQSKMIPFESLEAKQYNISIFKILQSESEMATIELAELYGEPELLKGYGRRNVTLLAVAPTTSSSFILEQVSPSVEPLNSNYYTKDLAKGKYTYKNTYLKKLLHKKGFDDIATWQSIMEHDGSVQHLECLTDEEKMVFKTFGEISQMEIVIQAAARQKYIDQAQSLNFMIHPSVPVKDINQLYIEAWKMGLKTLYYQRSTNLAQELGRNILKCVSCEA